MVKISVIVPVYGVEDYIKKCMDSLVNQTFKDFEIIVVNDGTKDQSIEIIKENYNDKRIKILNKQNGGLSDARNFALDKAKGEYLLYVDSDDYVDSEMLEKMYHCAKENDADIVECLASKVENECVSPLENNIHLENSDHIRYIINRPSAWGKLVKKELMEKKELSFVKGMLYEDVATMPALALYTKKIAFVNECLYYYVIRNGSIMNQSEYKEKMEDIFVSLNHLSELFKKKDKKNEYRSELEYLYITHLLHDSSLMFLPFKEGIVSLNKISSIMKKDFPKWRRNKYYKKENIKYKIICTLFYYRKYKLAKRLLKK